LDSAGGHYFLVAVTFGWLTNVCRLRAKKPHWNILFGSCPVSITFINRFFLLKYKTHNNLQHREIMKARKERFLNNRNENRFLSDEDKFVSNWLVILLTKKT